VFDIIKEKMHKLSIILLLKHQVFDIIKEKMYKSSIILLKTSSEQYLNNFQLYSGREQDYIQDIKR
jgi:hypothetical protein